MSARRQARATKADAAVTTVGGIPRCLALGRCLEVWAASSVIGVDGADHRHVTVIGSARWRYVAARRWWVQQAGIRDKDSWAKLPGGSTWSVDVLVDADARLERIGCTRAHLPALAEEANELHRRALLDGDPRKDMDL